MHTLRAHWATAHIAAISLAGDGWLVLANCLIRLLRVALLLSLWRLVLDPAEPVGGMSLAGVLTYTLVAQVFAEQLDPRTELSPTIWTGAVATRLLRPLGMVSIYAAELIGYWSFTFVTFSLPLLLAAPLLGVDARPASFEAGLWFALSLVLGVTVGLAIDFIFGAILIVLHESMWAIEGMRHAIGIVLSGAILPLALYPWGLGDLFGWLPFAAVGSVPLRVYIGAGEPFPLMLSQVAWALALWPLAHWLWRRTREQMVALGG